MCTTEMASLRHLEARVHEAKSLLYPFTTQLLAFSQLPSILPFRTYPQLRSILSRFLCHCVPAQVALHLHACGEQLTVSLRLSRLIISSCNAALTALQEIRLVLGIGPWVVKAVWLGGSSACSTSLQRFYSLVVV